MWVMLFFMAIWKKRFTCINHKASSRKIFLTMYVNYPNLFMVLNKHKEHGFKDLGIFLTRIGFVSSQSDSSLFIYNHQGSQCFLLVYVDDVLLTGNSPNIIQNIIYQLSQEFKLRDLGKFIISWEFGFFILLMVFFYLKTLTFKIC